MLRTKSTKKALRQSLRRKKQNLQRKTSFKEAIKKYRLLVNARKLEEAKKYLNEVYKLADKTAKTKAIKKGKADRIKSRLSHLLSKTYSVYS